MALVRLWNYYRDEVNDDVNGNNDAGICIINNNKIVANKSFEYKTKIIRSTPADKNTLATEVVVSLLYLNSFWISLPLL